MQEPLTERSAVELARAIRTGETTSRQVVEEHIALLEEVNPRINAVVAERLDAAREDAVRADERIARAAEGDELPPLLGVPCTIKESFAVAGFPNSAGLVARRELRSEATAPVARRLLDAGTVLLGVTNTPELCMWIETENRVYGRTRNAYDPRRVAGGSSGGEGAVVGSGASPIGLASDIGGSIRLPAFFNGVFGHKPSPGLLPNTGQFPATTGDAGRMLTPGPITRRGEDLMPLLGILAGPDGEDPLAVEAELGDPASVELEGLPVVLVDSRLVPPVRRELQDARDRAAEALAAAGADVRRLPLRRMGRVIELYLTTLQEGAGVSTRDLLAAEGVNPRWRQAFSRRGPHTRATWLLLFAERSFGRLPRGRARRVVEAGRRLAAELEEMVGDGVLLHPPFGRAAPRHGRTVGRPWVIAHAALFNLAGLPVTEVPVGLNRRGLPLGVQVVAGRGADHVAIAVALELERRLGGWVPPQSLRRP